MKTDKEIISDLQKEINELSNCNTIYDAEKKINYIEYCCSKYKNKVLELSLQIPSDEEIEISAFNFVSKLISRIGIAKKEVLVTKVRDIMALEKYDMIKTNPDYSYMKNGKNMYEAWDDYIKETISATPYFYPEPEATTIFKDPMIKDESEVMPWLNKQPKIKKF